MNNIKTICVCGAGTMGSGIAQVAAQAGFQTIQFDLNPDMVEKGKQSIQAGLSKMVEKGRMTLADKDAILNRILFTSDIQQCKADIIIEANQSKKKKSKNLDLFSKF